MKKTIIWGVLAAMLVGAGAFPVVSHALTRDEILAQIQVLLQQIAFLQAEISRLNGGGGNIGTCTTFVSNLSFGSSGSEVGSLQTVLMQQGFSISSGETTYQYFGAETQRAVIAFQEKYRSEILSPAGLYYGTGKVGYYTRAKLNQICGNGGGLNTYTGNIRVVSPNGGEQLQAGQNKRVFWDYSSGNNANFRIELWEGNNIVATSYANGTFYGDITPPYSAVNASDYKIKVIDTANSANYDWSDSYFSVYGGSGTNYGNNNITFTYPLGGEQLYAGNTMNVRWNNYNTSSYQSYRADLYKGSQFIMSVNDNGSNGADILLPSNLSTGSDYNIRLTGLSNGFTAQSNNFSINSSYYNSGNLRLVSPNGGEQYGINSGFNVQWQANSYITIELWKGSQMVHSFGSWPSQNGAGIVNLNLRDYAVAGTDYKVKIYDSNNSSNYDWSDSYFTIVDSVNISRSVSLTATPQFGAAPLTVTFTATLYNFPSCGNAYSWDFGDGTSVTTVIEDCVNPTILSVPSRNLSAKHTFWRVGNFDTTLNIGGITSNQVRIQPVVY